MEDGEQKNAWITWVLGGLAATFLVGGLFYWNQARSLNRLKDKAESKADSLQSATWRLQGNARALTSQLALSITDQRALRKQVDDASGRLNRSEATRQTLAGRTATLTQTNRQLNQRLTKQTTVRDSLSNQMVAMEDKIGWLTDSNTVLKNRASQLDQTVIGLNETMLTMAPRTMLTGDGFRVDVKKSNRKETAKAKKVNTLTISLSVSPELGLQGPQDVYVSLTSESSDGVIPPLLTTTVNLADVNRVIPVHAEQSVSFGPNTHRISFEIATNRGLKPGRYRAAVYTKTHYMGSTQFQLRDSFWFF